MLQKLNWQEGTNWQSMHLSHGLGLPLVGDGKFAADMLRFEPGKSTALHTHPGDHILFVVDGSGYLVFGGTHHNLSQGDCYYVPGSVPHQVGAMGETLVLLSVANDHRPVGSVWRSSLG